MNYWKTMVALLAALLALGLTACGGDDGDDGETADGGATAADGELIENDPANSDTTVTIGSKNFTEQYILGNIYAQALEAAGYNVQTELDLGSEQIAHRALTRGQIDAYPEYTGTALTSFYGYQTEEVPTDETEAYELARDEYANDEVTALQPAEFDNTYIIASTREKADELGNPTTISDLAANENAGDLSLAGFPECRQRTDCLIGLEEVYGWTPEFVSTEGKYEPIDNDQADLAFVFGTDGELSLDEYATYEDDQALFPPYNPTLAMRDDAVEAIGPEGVEVLERVTAPLNEEVMRELNARVDLEKERPEDVATQYLQEAGFIE